jgi:hypothetical protein
MAGAKMISQKTISQKGQNLRQNRKPGQPKSGFMQAANFGSNNF